MLDIHVHIHLGIRTHTGCSLHYHLKTSNVGTHVSKALCFTLTNHIANIVTNISFPMLLVYIHKLMLNISVYTLSCEPALVRLYSRAAMQWSSVVSLPRSDLESLSREWSVTVSESASLSFRLTEHDVTLLTVTFE